jgi:hypothetical protein
VGTADPPWYLVEVYVDDYIGLTIPTMQCQLDHVANGVMCAIHDIFLPDPADEEDPILLKKLLKLDGAWEMIKEILVFVFNGTDKTMLLAEGKRDAIMSTIKTRLQSTQKSKKF